MCESPLLFPVRQRAVCDFDHLKKNVLFAITRLSHRK